MFGQVEEGWGLVELVSRLPYVTGRAKEGGGTVADEVFLAQRRFFSAVAQSLSDRRAEDRTGRLLRRVEIVASGVLF